MGLHVSLPEEMENKVHERVKTGMYGSASEVVREALRRMFEEDGRRAGLTQDEIYSIMFSDAIEEFESGKAEILDDAEDRLDAIDKKYFGA